MQVNMKQPGLNVADFSIADAVITVAGVVVNTAEREGEEAKTIEIRTQDGSAHEGGTGAFLAQIEIPARRYVETEGEEDPETGEPRIVLTPVAFDPNRVALTLWPTA
jgi:hypothetical protein